MKINNIIFHQLEKNARERGEETVLSDYASNLLSPTDPIVYNFCEDIIESYRVHNPMWGNIDESKKFHKLIEQQQSGEALSFIDFSKNITDLIKDELSKATMGTGGFILILDYTYSSTNWLMVIILKNDEGYGVNDLLSLEKRKYLNLRKLSESARINLQQWSNNLTLDQEKKGNCLSFMKGKKDADITEYFRTALGCVGYQSSSKNTKALINAVINYMDFKEFSSHEKDAVRENLYNYCAQQSSQDLEIDLTTISRKVNAENPEDFFLFIETNNLMIDSSFKPSEKTYQRLRKISFNVGDVKISFTYDDLNDKVILSDEGLLIKSIPDRIINEIESYKPRINK